MSDEGTVEREITVPVDPERAWELVTEPEHLEQWFAERVELDPTPGAPVRVVGDDGGERHGVVEEVDDVSSHAVGDRMHVAYRFLIFLRRAQSFDAWPKTSLDVILQARSRRLAVDFNVAGAQLKCAVD
jgi:hypothetical protein